MPETNYLTNARTIWDREAATFDAEPDHGLGDPVVKAAWRQLLAQWLPSLPGHVLDLGCGTGSLSLLAAELGHIVMGIDCSPAMIERAQAKAAAYDLAITFHVMDAAKPVIQEESFDAVMCRHLLWTLPEPPAALQQWKNLLTPAGRMLLVEGFWATGGGLKMAEIINMLPKGLSVIETVNLSPLSILWGKTVNDERYAILLAR
ncbi:MAG: class I SAM-dependent methyltransferase [Caldilinea sp. CFX5]|nr:class I SAM-dependent methyltransferase [Caldilinea sp. CFX5]